MRYSALFFILIICAVVLIERCAPRQVVDPIEIIPEKPKLSEVPFYLTQWEIESYNDTIMLEVDVLPLHVRTPFNYQNEAPKDDDFLKMKDFLQNNASLDSLHALWLEDGFKELEFDLAFNISPEGFMRNIKVGQNQFGIDSIYQQLEGKCLFYPAIVGKTAVSYDIQLNGLAPRYREREEVLDTAGVIMPLFPGCEAIAPLESEACTNDKIIKHIFYNNRYPSLARENWEKGVVFVAFIVDEKGRTTELEILYGQSAPLNIQALKVLLQLPKMQPAMKDGKPTRVEYHVPLKYVF